MSRQLLPYQARPHGRILAGSEALVFHCNYYNYWLQTTLLLPTESMMEDVIREAAAAVAYATVQSARPLLGESATPQDRFRLAADSFSQQGFGRLDFSRISEEGGRVYVPTSHYGQCFFSASPGLFSKAQNLFDQGYVAGAAAAAFELPPAAFATEVEACHSIGGEVGILRLTRRDAISAFSTAAYVPSSAEEIPPPSGETHVNEPTILQALSQLNFSGNEEGFIPRFGVMLTLHYASFYNRISFEFIHRMQATNLLEYAEQLLVEAGHRCAFNTFGGIMSSAEWEAVVQPMCRTTEDWVHGMVAVVNALGWGTWRVHELSPKRLTIRIYDDYESLGYLGMYGKSARPVCYLAQGGVAGLMNLVYIGDIHKRPVLDEAFYARVFESPERFSVRQTRCLSMGDSFTEIVAER